LEDRAPPGSRADLEAVARSGLAAGSDDPSLLHELVFRDDYEAMQFLIDRGIDITILDYRWGATAEGWARYGASKEKMAEWLAEAARRRSHGEGERP
jgi:hypothetical protein